MAVCKCSSSVTVIKFDRIVKIQVLVLEFISILKFTMMIQIVADH